MRVWWIGMALLLAGCFTAGQQPSQLHEKFSGSKMSPAEVRIRVRSLASPFSGQLELMADEMAASVPALAATGALTRFKLDSIPLMQAALLRSDPIAALVDSWAFLEQLSRRTNKIALQVGAPPEAIERMNARYAAMIGELRNQWSDVTGGKGLEAADRTVDRWAAAHPLENLATRKSTEALLANLTEQGGLSALGTAAALLADTQDIVTRMDLLNAYAPKQARWSAEVFLRDAINDPTLFGGIDTEGALRALEKALVRFDQLPGILRSEREAVLLDLASERAIVLDAISREREITLAEAEAASNRLLDRSFEQGRALIDSILFRLLLFAALLLAAIVIAALIFLRRRPTGGQVVRRRRPIEA